MSEVVRDSLGDRMKSQYEDRTRYMLPRRTWTVIRADGKAFHSFTRHCAKPFDALLMGAMLYAAQRLCEEAQGAKIGYVQSDEISVVLTDFDRIETCAWFDGNLQKIASVAASIVTAEFNRAYRAGDGDAESVALFDARVFTIPDPVEVENYLIWRQKDAMRNSVQSYAQARFSPKLLHGKKQADMLAMLRADGVDWANEPAHLQRGVAIVYGDDLKWHRDIISPVFTEDREYMRRQLNPQPSEPEREER